MLLLQVRVEIAFQPAFTAGLLHHRVKDTWTDCNVVVTG